MSKWKLTNDTLTNTLKPILTNKITTILDNTFMLILILTFAFTLNFTKTGLTNFNMFYKQINYQRHPIGLYKI